MIISEKDYLKHYGVLGMHWGIRKGKTSGINYQIDRFKINKGASIHRMSSVSNEINKGSGYASFLKEDVNHYRQISSLFSKYGKMTQFDLTLKAKKVLVSPSQKERIDVFIKKMSDPEFSKELKRTQRRMFILNMVTPEDIKLSRRYKNIGFAKARAYRMLNQAISGNKKLRESYLNEFAKLGYDMIPDEGDIISKSSKAPIIFIKRENSLQLVRFNKL